MLFTSERHVDYLGVESVVPRVEDTPIHAPNKLVRVFDEECHHQSVNGFDGHLPAALCSALLAYLVWDTYFHPTELGE
jgi:hypothetical protein